MVNLIKTGKGYVMSDINDYGGLCLTCNNAATCKFLQNHNKTVWQCEEYDDRTGVISKSNTKKGTQHAESETSPASTGNFSEKIYKGLCVNCENRETCKHDKIEGGIWHCENYE